MSVSAADRARQNERLTQTREEDEEKEAKLLKRKNEQLKRAEQRHQAEIKKLESAYRNELSKVREEQSNTLAERDSDYQEKLGSTHKLYTQDLQRRMENAETDRKALQENYEGELDKQKYIAKSKDENLRQNQNKELMNREKALTDNTNHMHEKMKEAVDNTSRRLKEAHDKEMKVLTDHQSEMAIQDKIDKSEMQKSFDTEKRIMNEQAHYRDATWQQKYDDLENRHDGEAAESQAKIVTDGLHHVKEEFDDKLQKKSDEMDNSEAAFRQSVSDRVDDQVRSRDSKIQTLNRKLNNEVMNDRRMREMDHNNLQSSYENKMHDLEGQKNEMKETMQKLNSKRLGEMQKKNEQVLRRASNEYRTQAEIERARFRENALESEQLRQNELEGLNNRSDARLDRIQRTSEQNTKRLSDFYDDSMDQARVSFDKKSTDQREKNLELQGQNNRAMTERFKKIESNYANKLDTVTSQYEAKIQEMKDNHEKDIRRMEATAKLRQEDREKGYKTDKDSTEMKYEARIAMMEQEHQERLEKVQKKHQEEMRDLAMKLNQYNRKA
jgi:hypothetical protein